MRSKIAHIALIVTIVISAIAWKWTAPFQAFVNNKGFLAIMTTAVFSPIGVLVYGCILFGMSAYRRKDWLYVMLYVVGGVSLSLFFCWLVFDYMARPDSR